VETIDILKALTDQTGKSPILAAEEAFGRIEEFRPILLEAVEYAAANPAKILKTDSDLHLNALFILARARVHEAFAPAMKICRSRAYSAEYLIPLDVKNFFYHRILASLFDGNLESLKELLEKPRLCEDAYLTTLKTLCLLAKKGIVNREDTAEYLKSREKAAKLQDRRTDLGKAAKLLGMDEEEGTADDPSLPLHIQDYYELIEDFAGIEFLHKFEYDDFLDSFYIPTENDDTPQEAEERQPPSFTPRAAMAPARSTKTGRNDPCPCGSGKKFKKCHGAKA
jgi:uncharacterized protein YecA (UPF0149 family)